MRLLPKRSALTNNIEGVHELHLFHEFQNFRVICVIHGPHVYATSLETIRLGCGLTSSAAHLLQIVLHHHPQIQFLQTR